MSDDKKDKKDDESSTWRDVGWFALKTTAISGAVLGGTVSALPLIGVAAGGVAAGVLVVGLTVGAKAAAVAGGAVAGGAVAAHIAVQKLKKNDKTDSRHISEVPSENNKENDVSKDEENAELLKKNCKYPGLKTGSNSSARKNKKIPMKLVFSYRYDDSSNSLELIPLSPINDYKLDTFKKQLNLMKISQYL